MTIKEALSWAKNELESKEVEGPKTSAEFLLRQVLKVDRAYIFAHSDTKLSPLSVKKYKDWIKKRSKHEPVWYITGEIEFYGQDFHVNKNVLIPRPETEILVEKIINKYEGKKNLDILDIGTGSGAIILSLAKQLEDYCSRESRATKDESSHNSSNNKYFASDLSEKALSVAKKNAKRLKLNVKFKKGDLFGPWVGQNFDVIVTNLPYVPHEDMNTLAYDLIHYEPRLALDGGLKGLEIYQRFFEELSAFVNPGATIYCEIGDQQGDALEQMVKRAFPKAKVEVVNDYADFERIVIVEIPV